jgi:glycosyltransferase involved in cell wall biosynthesis
MAEHELVTIGIPAYNSARFLEAAVESALTQDYPHIRILISVDLSTDGTADLANRLARSHGLDVVVQPRRLGWVGNSNVVLNLMKSPYGMILPHDDLLRQTYVTRCMEALRANEAAAVACSDLRFVDLDSYLPQVEFRGDRVERAIRCITDGFSAVSYRGVIRFDKFRRRSIPETAGGFVADTVWMLRMALAGEVIRVPEILYRKTVHEKSTHLEWARLPAHVFQRRWLAHVAEMQWLLLRDAPSLLLDPRVRDALRIRTRRIGGAPLDSPSLPGWAGRLPLVTAQLEYLRYVLRLAV